MNDIEIVQMYENRIRESKVLYSDYPDEQIMVQVPLSHLRYLLRLALKGCGGHKGTC